MSAAGISFEKVTETLSADDRAVVAALHQKALDWGYSPSFTPGAKFGYYKGEYKKTSKGGSLFILRLEGPKWFLKPKLFHLDVYSDLLEALPDPIRTRFLKSRGCGMDMGNCKGPVRFRFADVDHAFCRHNMQLSRLGPDDLPAVLALLEREKDLSL